MLSHTDGDKETLLLLMHCVTSSLLHVPTYSHALVRPKHHPSQLTPTLLAPFICGGAPAEKYNEITHSFFWSRRTFVRGRREGRKSIRLSNWLTWHAWLGDTYILYICIIFPQSAAKRLVSCYQTAGGGGAPREFTS